MAIKTGRELAGLAVVGLSGGDRLGRVDDVVFEVGTGRVVGFLVDRGGMFSKAKFLAAAQVRGLGADALTIEGEAALVDYDAATLGASTLAMKPLDGRPVLTQAGSVLGKIADVGVETDTLTVPYFLISTGLLDNTLHGRPHLPLASVQTVGADSVIVLDSYDPKSSEARA